MREANIPDNDNDPRQDRPTPSEEEEQQAYRWFDTLDFPDLAPCPFVKVATGLTFWKKDEPPRNTYCVGFLLSDEAGEFSVFSLDLRICKYRTTPPGTPEHAMVGHEEAHLASLVGEYLKQQEEPTDRLTQALRSFAAHLGECADRFVLARACAGKGEAELAHRLWLHAQNKHAESRQPRSWRSST